jgi:fructose-1,6-bisphosphatase/inositol monophosphatase family enzyme
LEKLMPGSEVIGEEAVSGGRAFRELLSTADHPVWVVDPVDGTSNFANGIATYGTMVALIHRGERITSWIYQIPLDRIITAEKGAGIKIDRAPFQLLPKIEDDLPFGYMDAFVSRKFMPPPMRPEMEEKFKQLRTAATCMCCAWEYIDVLEGKAAFSVYSRIEPWDHMAGALILEEAGFCTRKWDKSPYLGTDLKGGLINAPSEALWQRIYDEFMAEALKSLPRG